MTLEKHLINACQRKGLIEPDAAKWILPILVDGEERGLGIDQIGRNIRSAVADKNLTTLGKQDPVNAVCLPFQGVTRIGLAPGAENLQKDRRDYSPEGSSILRTPDRIRARKNRAVGAMSAF